MRRLNPSSNTSPLRRKLATFVLVLGVMVCTPIHVGDSLAQENTKEQPSEPSKTTAPDKELPPSQTAQPDTSAATTSAQDTAAPGATTEPPDTKEACLVAPSERGEIVQRIKKMRPKSAAKLFAALPPELAADLLLRLDARQSARIMNELPPHTGATLVTILSQHDSTSTTSARSDAANPSKK